MKKIILIFLFLPILLIAQNNKNVEPDTLQQLKMNEETDFTMKDIDMILNQSIPPAPNAAEFSKVQDLSVDEYTGAFSTVIPLFTLKSRGIELPISLNYHTSGIKVDQEASNVGLGWSLSAGGVINRTIKGICDEMSYSSSNGLIGSYFVGYQRLNYGEPYDEHSADRLPDEFSINVPGMISGNFYFTKDREILEGSYNGFMIEESRYSTGDLAEMIKGFEIVDQNGINYSFAEVEKIETRSKGDKPLSIQGNFRKSTSSFYLDEIVNSNNISAFSFIYETYSIDGGNLVEQRDSYLYNYFGDFTNNTFWCQFCSDHLYEGWQYSNIPYSWNYRKLISAKRLQKIIFQDGYLLFAYGQNRDDVENDQALTSIELYTLDNVMVKKYELNYDYFVSTGSSNSYLNKRLKLISIVESGKDEVELPPYQFLYNELELAPKRSFKSDFWGYNNGDTESDKYFPNLYYYPDMEGHFLFPFPLTNYPYEEQIFTNDYSSDKSPNNYVIAGALELIRYQTGAYHKIIYEPNDFSYRRKDYQGNGIRVKEFEVYSENALLRKIKYKYQREGYEESSGSLSLIPQFGYECNGMTNGGIVFTSSNNNVPKYSKESLITYSCVTKEIYNSDETQFNGSIVSEYYTQNDYDNLDVRFFVPGDPEYCENISIDPFEITKNDYPFINNFSNELLRGSIKERKIYDNESNLLQRQEETPRLIKFDSIKILDRRTYFYHFAAQGDLDYPVTGTYYLRSAVSKPSNSISEDRFGTKIISKSIERIYDDKANLSKVSKITSDGVKDIQLEYKYLYDFNYNDLSGNENVMAEGFYLMDAKNMNSTPIETIKKVGQNDSWKVVAGELNSPIALSDNVLGFDDIQYLQSLNPIDENQFVFTSLDANGDYIANDNYEKSIVFEEYDSETGQILQLKKENGISIVILWGYGKLYPVAKILNSSFDEMEEVLRSQYIADYEALQSMIDSEDLIELFSRIRELPEMKNAQIISYTYKPLEGVESITDVNDLTTHYYYDGHGRLEKITNDEDFILQYMEYHYKSFEDCFSSKQSCETQAYSTYLIDEHQCLMDHHIGEPEYDECLLHAETDYGNELIQCGNDYEDCVASGKK